MNGIMPGVYVGTVESNMLDDEGRIEISLKGVSNNAKPYYARIATLMAGNGYGTVFLPEKDDQVLVAFINGAISEPIVIGGVWNKKDKPPEVNADGKNTVKLIKTRGGNEIRLIDKDGGEKIEIVDKTGHNKITIDTQNNSIGLAADGAINIVGKSVTIRSTNGNITIDSTAGNGVVNIN